jgi:hypothetical protein
MPDPKKKKSKKSIYNAIGFSNKDIDRIKGIGKKIGNTKVKDVPKKAKAVVKEVIRRNKAVGKFFIDEYKYKKKLDREKYRKKVDKVRRKYRPKDYDSKGNLKKNH